MCNHKLCTLQNSAHLDTSQHKSWDTSQTLCYLTAKANRSTLHKGAQKECIYYVTEIYS